MDALCSLWNSKTPRGRNYSQGPETKKVNEFGIVHAANFSILLGNSLDDVKISDFGLARDLIASTVESELYEVFIFFCV